MEETCRNAGLRGRGHFEKRALGRRSFGKRALGKVGSEGWEERADAKSYELGSCPSRALCPQ
jgi:hypothetical protein